MSSIDALLYRPLQSGSQFEGLIPPYKGTEYNFDKESDNSTTYDTLRYMAQWSNKYAYQMKRIAPLLKGATVQETANNIYQFLYNHFQYKLDGSLQNLYSPSAAWHFRKTGFDCKTYSLLASCILQNMNITHSFRMVQQLGIMPGEWSHVYVIIPQNNTEYVIDATTHTNKQVSYTKKHDYVMKHLGLASPYINGLGCACQGKPITLNGLGAPGNLETTIANFHNFLNELEKKGVPKATTDKMLALVRYNVENGIDPNMHEIVQKAMLPSGKLGEILPLTSYLQPAGTTYSTTPISNVAVQGTSLDSIIGAATGLLTGNPLAVLSLIPIEKTFGQVFANGFDLSCWGASYSEQKAKKDLESWLPFIKQWSGIYTNASSENLDRFQFLTQAFLNDAANGQRSKYASCTRKGWALVQKGMEQLRKDVHQDFTNNNFQLVSVGTKTNAQWKVQLPNRNDNYGWASPSVVYDSYRVIPPQQAPQQPQQQQQYQTITNADGTTSQVPVPNEDKPVTSASSSTPLIIGGALLALKLLI